MNEGPQVMDRPRQDLELEPQNIEVLAYIQSNKFITTHPYHQKFNPTQTYKTAHLHLRNPEEVGLLLKTQNYPNDDTYYYLTRPALHRLNSLTRIPASPVLHRFQTAEVKP